MKFRILTVLLSLFLIGQNVLASPFNAKAKTKRIPAGTQFSIQLLNPISSIGGYQGKEFSAVLLSDQSSDSDVILPMGSLVRGSILRVVPTRRLSKGAIVYLDFDHVVAPNGRQLPLSMSIVGRSDLTYDGGLTTSRGYGDAMKQSWQTTKKIAKTSTDWGNDTFEDVAGGYLRIITLPLSAIGGGIGGGGYYVYSAAANAIKKGKDVNIPNGEVLKVILTQPVDVPVI